MEELYKLKEMLCDELKEYGGKGEMSTGSLDVVDKLAHTIKNLDKIIETYDEEYSGYYPMYYGENRSYEGRDGSYENRGLSNRGSYARGRGARRDAMGRYSSEGYSRHGDMAEQLREMMNDAPNHQIRQEIERLVKKIDQM